MIGPQIAQMADQEKIYIVCCGRWAHPFGFLLMARAGHVGQSSAISASSLHFCGPDSEV